MEALADYFGCTSMNTESQHQIAREAASAMIGRDENEDWYYEIILSAIERATEFHSSRWNALQKAQHDMRDPERKMVCDILANGSTSAQPQRSNFSPHWAAIEKVKEIIFIPPNYTSEIMGLEIINKLYLELSQITTARNSREIAMVDALRNFVDGIEGYKETGVWPDNGTLRRWADEGLEALRPYMI